MWDSSGDEILPAWVRCMDCADFICTVHGLHVYDCNCPDVETWMDDGYDPYETPMTAKVLKWLHRHPYRDE